MTDPQWMLEGSQGRIHSESLDARCDLSRPWDGIHRLVLDGQKIPGTILAIHWPSGEPGDLPGRHLEPDRCPIVDPYVRGPDLIASYDLPVEQPFRVTAYWHVGNVPASGPDTAVLALMLSVQTELLNSHPTIHVTTHIDADEIWYAAGDAPPRRIDADRSEVLLQEPGFVVSRLAGTNWSYAEMVHASDFQRVRLGAEDAARNQPGGRMLEWQVFGGFLEKGVIRRARLQAVLLARENDLERAATHYAAFAQSAAPLTA